MIDPRTRYLVNNQGMIKETPLNDECKFFTDPEIKVREGVKKTEFIWDFVPNYGKVGTGPGQKS